jgi:CheY-like chemotaxis protein
VGSGSPLVLVVEDDFTLRYLAKRQLASLGFACDLAEDGAEALEKVQSQEYVLILMDVQMPIMSGLEAAQAIRQHEAGNNSDAFTPIIAMTANPEKQRCFDAGMNDFMFKPISLLQMEEALTRWVPAH